MPLIQQNFQTLLSEVKRAYPGLIFVQGTDFAWSASINTITYAPKAPQGALLLLHELAHTELHHDDYTMDIDLLRQEAQAWQYARTILAERFKVAVGEDFVQDCLDTYRDWLHKRSLCPGCSQVGLQTKKNNYSCINCSYSWRTNDARQCSLRRFRLQAQDRSSSPER
jgi:hypothetical protein